MCVCVCYWTFTDLLVCWFQVLVIIDAKPKDLGLPTEAYISVEEVHDVSLYCNIKLTQLTHRILGQK